jgi:subtilisin family serine protease
MKRKLLTLTVFVLLTLLAIPFTTAAAPGAAQGDPDLRPAGKIDTALRRQRTGPAKIVIELADAPATQAFAAAQAHGSAPQAIAAAQRQVARIESAQQALLAPLAQANATVIYRVQRVYNGIAAIVDSRKLAEIARLPGVKALHPLITKHLDNSSSVPLIGAPQLWDSAGLNVSGTDIKVGIIDTGIDYIHTDFGGTGLKADYDRNNTTAITETGTLFPSAKVVGGYDFVGDDYNADAEATSTPQPDPDPMDCNDHGTHVAGTTAGFGVNADGSKYTGTYGPATSFNALKIGPGVAPSAKLYALRIFGCNGSSDVVDQAIEWAVDPNGDGNFSDHLDVINMSLGSDFGGTGDSTSIASENAVQAGVIVVASAGNSGDTNYITGSPGSADSVISVASSVDARSKLDAIIVDAPAAIAGNKPASFAQAYDWATNPNVTGAVVYPPSQQSGCDAFTPANIALITGKIVILDWTDDGCGGSVKRTGNVLAAGGIGAIIVDNSDNFDLFITGSDVIRSVSVPKSVGDQLKANLTGLNVTFDGTLVNSQNLDDLAQIDTLSSFSSRGPRRSGVLKPDITAPGESIFSAAYGTGNAGLTLSGTSMAAPHVTGSMALLRQLHPTWTVAQLKALAMNTANKDLRSATDPNAQIYGPARVGAGRINLPNAGAQSVIAFNKASPNLVSVSFGTLEVTGTTTLSRQVTVLNKGAGSATYNLSYTPIATIPGVSYSVTPAQVTLAAGASSDVNVTLTADASKMKHTHDPTVSESQVQDSRHWISEASGYLTFSVPAANAGFSAAVHGYYENPPVVTDYSATATFVYTDSTNTLGYDVRFSSPITLTMGHIHQGLSGLNGGVLYTLTSGGNSISRLAGNVTLSAADEALLLNGGLYVNFHTTANPSGELRGQIVPTSPELRLPIYTAARPASRMSAQSNKLALSKPSVLSATTAITLTGSGLDTGANTPLDEKAIVTAFELQHTSPRIVASSLVTSSADLRYVGVTSTFTPTGNVANSEIYFGVASQDNWSTPSEVEFDIYIDTDFDDNPDYVLYNTASLDGSDHTDVFISKLYNFATNDTTDEDYINAAPASTLDTVPFNTNVMVIPVRASALGLATGSSRFRYHVVAVSYAGEFSADIDSTPTLIYDPAKPGVDFSDGISGTPAFFDAPGSAIAVSYDRNNLFANASKGVLLLHHHNLAGAHAEAVTTPTFVLLPLQRR